MVVNLIKPRLGKPTNQGLSTGISQDAYHTHGSPNVQGLNDKAN